MPPAQDQAVTEVLANLSIGYIVLAALVLTLIRMILVPSKSTFARSVAELVESLIIAGVLVFMIIRPFFLQAFFIPSESMEPTLAGHRAGYQPTTNITYDSTINDHIFVNKLIYRFSDPKPGDIIVFRAPKEADQMSREEGRPQLENVLIKRLVAVGGQKIEVRGDDDGNAKVYVNDKPVNESQIKFLEPMKDMGQMGMDSRVPGAPFGINRPLVLKKDELFVMGDNRNHSNDSRFWGPLKRDRVIGKASFIFWPLSRIRLIR
jgi:signal peptidase I